MRLYPDQTAIGEAIGHALCQARDVGQGVLWIVRPEPFEAPPEVPVDTRPFYGPDRAPTWAEEREETIARLLAKAEWALKTGGSK